MLPNLVVLGAMKCATTSLHHYLGLHPEIAMARERGLNFFLEANFARGLDWYADRFDGAAQIRGDTSPRYTNYPLDPGVAERMARSLPDAKLLYVVRDPVERLVSHYTHYFAAGHEDRSLEEALADVEQEGARNPYLCRSLYHLQLSRYLAHFPKAQLHVLAYDTLRDRPTDALGEVFRFLELSDVTAGIDEARLRRVHHRTSRKRRLSASGRRVAGWLARPLAPLPQDARVSLSEMLTRPWSQAVERPVLSASLEARLRALLRDDGLALQTWLGRALPWPL